MLTQRRVTGANVQAWGGGLAVCPEGQPQGTEPDPLCLVAVSVSWLSSKCLLEFYFHSVDTAACDVSGGGQGRNHEATQVLMGRDQVAGRLCVTSLGPAWWCQADQADHTQRGNVERRGCVSVAVEEGAGACVEPPPTPLGRGWEVGGTDSPGTDTCGEGLLLRLRQRVASRGRTTDPQPPEPLRFPTCCFLSLEVRSLR